MSFQFAMYYNHYLNNRPETPPILREAALQEELDERGFVKVSMFSEEQLAELNAVYERFVDFPGDRDVFTISYEILPLRSSTEIDLAIKAVIRPSLDRVFRSDQLNFVGGAFALKPPGDNAVITPHQDHNAVDERFGDSYNLWFPLHKVDAHNGQMLVQPESHKRLFTLRGVDIMHPFSEINELMMDHMTPVPMAAGEALVLNNRCIHASQHNRSTEMRRAILFGMAPSATPLVKMFYNSEKEQVDIYELDLDFLSSHRVNEIPGNFDPIDSIPYHLFNLSTADYQAIFGTAQTDIGLQLSNRLKQVGG